MHKPAGGIAAYLTGVEGDGAHQLVGDSVDIDIVEDHRRALAAQFQLHGHQIAAARFRDQLAHFG